MPQQQLAQALAQLRLLLPDLDASLAGRAAGAAAWGRIADALALLTPAGGSVDWPQHEAALMQLVHEAIRCEQLRSHCCPTALIPRRIPATQQQQLLPQEQRVSARGAPPVGPVG